ncbi:von Willebrand factor A domain-containing protein 5B1 isoform X1 [Alligator mississippiensis]|uniref:von Willebrand factor A domain-containing protein 5B1 isoform X1 n=1 Tax=Alligator mississippiensis TaxID=8496 RepID=UPI00287792C5|nr:von Willebrand factor A domain-containing protein 5B1 isoform X1 [Alligator mississippiensis]XP_019355585.2 von Willebrand factor A domain-containing protein 5B1 isoform X1 [Alligator mississippiensis]
MPGLINRTTSCPLPLTASEVTSCVSGYAFGMTASLTYGNPETHPFEGLFVYPLDEYTTVVGFEAVVSRRAVTVQIKDKSKMDDSYFDCSNVSNGRTPDGSGRLVLDEDLERILFVVNLGMIPPLESISIFISTSSELQTLPSGAVRVLLPAVCVPSVPQSSMENSASLSGHQLRVDRHNSGAGGLDQGHKLCLARLLESEASNPTEYEFSFHLEIRGPCLLAGVESPTHEIRADADPSARSAKSIMITLANRHTFDRPVEILIHPSEPHMPHILMEEGDMTPAEYEQHLKGRNDFIKGTKKDPSAEKKTEIIRKRLHKDLPHHPVIMLNFCPNLRNIQPDLRKAQGEFIFLIDRSGSMSGVSINRVKDALLVILKSLVPACLFNVIGFGSTFKTLFPSSQTYCEESLAIACESIKKIRADMGGTNILSPLKWAIRQPIHRGHPRLLFLLTDGAVSNTGKVIELLRNHSASTRCYSFGIGQSACRRLVHGLAAVSKGSAEFLVEGERLQPKMIKSLKKAMGPVLSDITVEWVFPETTEVLISPVSASCLFPGDRLVGYGIVCDTSLYTSNPRSDKRRRYSMLHSQESGSSVFFHSQEEGPGADGWSYAKDSELGFPSDRTPELLVVGGEPGRESDTDTGVDPKSSRRRAYSTNQIADREPFKKVPTASDPSAAMGKNPLRKAHVQDLCQISPEPQSWQADFQPLTASPYISTTRIRGTGAKRPSLLHQSCMSFCHDTDSSQLQNMFQHMVPGKGLGSAESNFALRSSSDSRSPGDLESAQHPSFTFETETSSDWEPQDLDVSSARGSLTSPRGICKAVVKGLRSNEPVQWEITFDIRPLFWDRERQESSEGDLWNETFHHLAAKSIIRDFEQLSEKECEIEHGSGRRYQLNAIHTSKACNVISKYTAFVPVDLSTNGYLPTVVEYTNAGAAAKQGSQRSSGLGSRRHRGFSIGLGRTQSTCGQDRADDGLSGLNMEENGLSPCSTPSSSGWERYSFPEAPLQSPSASSTHSQKSIESLFAARLTLNKTRLLTRAAKGFMSKSPNKVTEPSSESDNENKDYLPLVSLQLACGAFLLNSALCDATNIPMEKLKWTSPFSCHRMTLSPSAGSYSTRKPDTPGEAKSPAYGQQLQVPGDVRREGFSDRDFISSPLTNGHGEGQEDGGCPRHFSGSEAESLSRALQAENELFPPAITIHRFSPQSTQPPPELQSDSGRGSETDDSELQALLSDVELQQRTEPEGMLWATAIALAWLEHSSASYFIEWELVAAKASIWLSEQEFPPGCGLATVKAAARQLFVLLRHWDENLEFNLLCYNPNNV